MKATEVEQLMGILDKEHVTKAVKQTSLIPWQFQRNNMFLYRIDYKDRTSKVLEIDRHYPNSCECIYESEEDVKKRLEKNYETPTA